MPFDHNDYYHSLVLRHVPPGARTALDVGCGTGKFARKLAEAGLAVEGIDACGEVIEIAEELGSPPPGTVAYRQADITAAPLSERHYDFISCLALLHHVPFETVRALRAALAPGGVLAVLGLAKPRSAVDWVNWLVLAPPANLGARMVVAAAERLNSRADPLPKPPISDESMSMTEVRLQAKALLPGSSVRTLLFWRYLLIYRA